MIAEGTPVSVWGAGVCACLAVALLLPRPAAIKQTVVAPTGAPADVAEADWMLRWRWLLALSAGIGAGTFLGGPAGAVAAPVAAVTVWVIVGRAEPAQVRRTREQAARELPHVVRLLGVALTSGAPPAEALDIIADALPGPAGERLRPVATRLRLSTRQRKHLGAVAARRGDLRPARQLTHAIGLDGARDAWLLAGDTAAARAAAEALHDWEVPVLPIKGGDIVARGVAAGPDVASILRAVEAAWVAEDYPDAARVAALVDQMIGRVRDSRQ